MCADWGHTGLGGTYSLLSIMYNVLLQGLKYNFQGGGTVQLSQPRVCFPLLCFSSGCQLINGRLNVLSMISCFFAIL